MTASEAKETQTVWLTMRWKLRRKVCSWVSLACCLYGIVHFDFAAVHKNNEMRSLSLLPPTRINLIIVVSERAQVGSPHEKATAKLAVPRTSRRNCAVL